MVPILDFVVMCNAILPQKITSVINLIVYPREGYVMALWTVHGGMMNTTVT